MFVLVLTIGFILHNPRGRAKTTAAPDSIVERMTGLFANEEPSPPQAGGRVALALNANLWRTFDYL